MKSHNELLSSIKKIQFNNDQYRRVKTRKNQICLHHSVSGNDDDSLIAVARYWKKDSSRIATPILIAKSGLIGQLYSTKYYGGHIGFDHNKKAYKHFNVPKKYLSRISIGVELLNWGGLTMINDKFYNAYGSLVNCDIQHYPEKFRGYEYFEKYSAEQIESLRKLILYWHDVYGIPLDYNDDIWDVCKRAITGEPGIFSHVSYRFEKSDCHPQPELIEMLKSLKHSSEKPEE